MKLIIAKILISVYLIGLAYIHSFNNIEYNTLTLCVNENIKLLNISERNKEFLREYLIKVMLFTLWTSILTVISKNILPKIFNITGLLLWLYFGSHPQLIIQTAMIKIVEEIAIIGGLIFIAGSEYTQLSFLPSLPQQLPEQKKNS